MEYQWWEAKTLEPISTVPAQAWISANGNALWRYLIHNNKRFIRGTDLKWYSEEKTALVAHYGQLIIEGDGAEHELCSAKETAELVRSCRQFFAQVKEPV